MTTLAAYIRLAAAFLVFGTATVYAAHVIEQHDLWNNLAFQLFWLAGLIYLAFQICPSLSDFSRDTDTGDTQTGKPDLAIREYELHEPENRHDKEAAAMIRELTIEQSPRTDENH